MKKTQIFKNLMKTERSILMPVAHDALTAKIIERTGFKAFSLGGFSAAASRLGLPDLGLLSFTEMLQAVKETADAVSLPMLADADTGYGGIFNVTRTVHEYEKAGAALMFIEDQTWPKRCGHMNGKEVADATEMILKIKAAVTAREDPDFLIVARTDARATHNLKEAIRRGRLYAQAGADVVFVEAPESAAELKTVAQEIQEVPLLVNMMEGGKTPLLSQKELAEMGFKLIAWPLTSLLASAQAVTSAMRELKEKGTTQKLLPRLTSFAEIKDLLGIESFRKLERAVTEQDNRTHY